MFSNLVQNEFEDMRWRSTHVLVKQRDSVAKEFLCLIFQHHSVLSTSDE